MVSMMSSDYLTVSSDRLIPCLIRPSDPIAASYNLSIWRPLKSIEMAFHWGNLVTHQWWVKSPSRKSWFKVDLNLKFSNLQKVNKPTRLRMISYLEQFISLKIPKENLKLVLLIFPIQGLKITYRRDPLLGKYRENGENIPGMLRKHLYSVVHTKCKSIHLNN